MTPRIFICYRTSDGVDKATALARELNAVFGDEQVFIDKEDLPAGQPWREAIGAALDREPILLLLITPQLLGPRLQDADDPVRREVAAALEFGAHVIPVLGDGVEQLPPPQEWPEAMHSLSERTWRRLRAYDWREDVDRLVADLQLLGVPPMAVDAKALPPPVRRRLGLPMTLAFAAGALIGNVSGGGSASLATLQGDAGASVVEAVLEIARGIYR